MAGLFYFATLHCKGVITVSTKSKYIPFYQAPINRKQVAVACNEMYCIKLVVLIISMSKIYNRKPVKKKSKLKIKFSTTGQG